MDMWSIMFQTDKMKNQGEEYYLQSLDLSPGYRWLRDREFMLAYG